MQDSVPYGPNQGPESQPPLGGGSGSGPDPQGSDRRFGGARGWLAAIAAALVIGLIGGFLLHGSSKAVAAPAATVTVVKSVPAVPVAAPTDSSSATATATTTATSDATASDSPGASSGPDATGLGTVSLINLTPASGHFSNADAKPVLGGQAQTFALSDTMSTCNGSAANDVGYDLGKNYTQFAATFGVDDTSPDETVAPQVEIDGDGLKLATYTPKLGHSAQVKLNVTGVLRLDIKWLATSSQACGYFGYLVIGNAQLTTVPGYHPSPAASSN